MEEKTPWQPKVGEEVVFSRGHRYPEEIVLVVRVTGASAWTETHGPFSRPRGKYRSNDPWRCKVSHDHVTISEATPKARKEIKDAAAELVERGRRAVLADRIRSRSYMSKVTTEQLREALKILGGEVPTDDDAALPQ